VSLVYIPVIMRVRRQSVLTTGRGRPTRTCSMVARTRHRVWWSASRRASTTRSVPGWTGMTTSRPGRSAGWPDRGHSRRTSVERQASTTTTWDASVPSLHPSVRNFMLMIIFIHHTNGRNNRKYIYSSKECLKFSLVYFLRCLFNVVTNCTDCTVYIV